MKLGKNLRLLGRTRDLEIQIDQFLDSLSEASLAFKHAIGLYLDIGWSRISQKHQRVDRLESEADRLRREIEIQLYTQTLIPLMYSDCLKTLIGSST